MTVTATQPSTTRVPSRLSEVLGVLSRFGLAVVWLVSGYQKMSDPMAFRQSVQAYELFSPELVSLIALLLPPVEIILGLFFLLGLFLIPSSIVTVLIMMGFICGIASAWMRGLEINCGCFSSGDAEPSSYGLVILRDIIFIAMACWTIKYPFRKLALHP